jgi:hypothetical protein
MKIIMSKIVSAVLLISLVGYGAWSLKDWTNIGLGITGLSKGSQRRIEFSLFGTDPTQISELRSVPIVPPMPRSDTPLDKSFVEVKGPWIPSEILT